MAHLLLPTSTPSAIPQIAARRVAERDALERREQVPEQSLVIAAVVVERLDDELVRIRQHLAGRRQCRVRATSTAPARPRRATPSMTTGGSTTPATCAARARSACRRDCIVVRPDRLIARLARYAAGFAGSNTLPSKNFSTPRDVRLGNLRRRHLQFLRRRPPQILAVDLRDQRLEVFLARELAPSDILREEPQLVALVGIRGVVAPELHEVRAVVDDLAGAVVELALQAADDVVVRHVEPGALGDDLRELVAVFGLVTPHLRFLDGHEQRQRRLRDSCPPSRRAWRRISRDAWPTARRW